MRLEGNRARVAFMAQFAIESLEKRLCLSAPSIVAVSHPAVNAAAAVTPWTQIYPGLTDTGKEQLIASAVVPVLGGPGGITHIEAVLGDVQNFSAPGAPFLPTGLRLYLSSDGGTNWHEEDINTAFDGRADTRTVGLLTINTARKDDQMAMDAQGNLYIEYSSDASALAVDRIPASMLLALATGGAVTPFNGVQVLGPANVAATGSGRYRPQLAVGSDAGNPGQSVVYLYNGDPNTGEAGTWLYRWEGTDAQDFSAPVGGANALWTAIDDTTAAGGAGGYWAPMSVGPDGELYATDAGGTTIYRGTASGLTALFPAPPGGAHDGLVAYAPPAGGATTLYALAGDAQGRVTVASTPASGTGAWTYPKTPIDPLNGGIVNSSSDNADHPRLAVDPATGQVSVLYHSANGTLTVAAGLMNPANTAVLLWSRQVVSSPASFATPQANGTYGNDDARVQMYSVLDGKASVAWMQNDATVSGTPNDVVAQSIDITASTGDVLMVANDAVSASHAITLSGSTLAGGTMSVVVDGQTYTLNLTSDLIEIIVTGTGNAALTIDETGAARPIPSSLGIDFENAGASPGTLKILGAGATLLGDGYLATASGNIALAHTAAVELDLSAGNDQVTAALDMNAPSVGSLRVVSGAGTDRVALTNVGAPATAAATPHLFSEGSFTLDYDANLANITLAGGNVLQALDFRTGSVVPAGSITAPGFVDIGASGVAIDGGSGNEAITYGPNDLLFMDGHYMTLAPSALYLGDGNDSVVVSTNFLGQVLTIYGGAGSDSVAQAGHTLGSGQLVFDGGSGDDTLWITSRPSGVPYTVFNGGAGANTLNLANALSGTYVFTTTAANTSWTQRLTVNVGMTPPAGMSVDPAEDADPPVARPTILEFDQRYDLKAINIQGTSKIVFGMPERYAVFSADTLNIAATATLDLGIAGLLLNRGALDASDPSSVVQTVYQWVVNGYDSPDGVAAGDWNGTGINIHSLKSGVLDPDSLTTADRAMLAIGVWDSTDAGVLTGQAAGKVLVGMAVLGDANGDGIADNTDHAIVHDNFGGGDHWAQGDFNYDQFVDNTDYAILHNNFGNSPP